ncbi:Pre-mRNA-splicing factor cwf19 [Malassezia cuniculi]|uniref:Pre-mRNA-splicing factor cwf19 n=1 Tax=Malassezia cuniculi TaxID=948313 RepID=A0AAF0JBL6_9BASI|nr:Pre-mRNA-splicing factor cwf19 [Malassezia cuniculi]
MSADERRVREERSDSGRSESRSHRHRAHHSSSHHSHSRHGHRSHRDYHGSSSTHGHHSESRSSRRPEHRDERKESAEKAPLERDAWMLGGDDFSSLGAARPPKRAQPETDTSRHIIPSAVPPPREPRAPGAPGFQWRMTKLRRVFEMAEASGRPVEEVALERYATLDAFRDACAERDAVQGTHRAGSSEFKRPNTQTTELMPQQVSASRPVVPSVIGAKPMSLSELNKFEARVLRAELAHKPEAAALRAELENEKRRVHGDEENARVEIVPVIDAAGRVYDIGGSNAAQAEQATHKRRSTMQQIRAEEARDNAQVSLEDLVREERFSAGRRDQKDSDAIVASQIAADAGFQNDLDYMDDEAARFARKRIKTDALKRQFAVDDFAKTKHALDTCPFCWQDDGATPPRTAIISSGTAAYLAYPHTEPLTAGHVWIVPIQHHTSSLDVDEDGWTEIRNFMKCLMRKAAAENCAMVFFETVLSLREQKHTFIEAVPVPSDVFDEIPAYFNVALSEVESEWADHAKIIKFSESRPFQRSMVSRLPYFMVQWDYKGQRGYGHVIESRDDEVSLTSSARRGGYEEPTYDDGDHVGGGAFPRWFAQEILGNLLDLPPNRWRVPDRVRDANRRVEQYRRAWDAYDWTHLINT